MANQQENHVRPADIFAGKALSNLGKNYLIIGRGQVVSWKAWLVIGLAAGISLGVIFVANRSARFERGEAATPRLSEAVYPAKEEVIRILARPLHRQEVQSLAERQAIEKAEIFRGRVGIQGESLATDPGLPCHHHRNPNTGKFHAGLGPVNDDGVTLVHRRIGAAIAFGGYDKNVGRHLREYFADFFEDRLP